MSVNNQELENLIAQAESSTLEFKERISPPEIVARLIASFANGEGGIIIFGIRDSHQVIGIDDEQRLQKVVNSARRMVTGEVDVDLSFAEIQGKKLGVLTVKSSKGIVAAGGGYYRRVGEVSRPMTAEEIQKHLAPTEPNNPALTELSTAVAQQTQIIEQLREDFNDANATWKKILIALGGAIAGAVLKFLIEQFLLK
jgi:predicted HTH transcriptional regulator